MATKCNKCALMCGLLDIPTASIPKDNPVPIRGVTHEGLQVANIVPYCVIRYTPPQQ